MQLESLSVKAAEWVAETAPSLPQHGNTVYKKGLVVGRTPSATQPLTQITGETQAMFALWENQTFVPTTPLCFRSRLLNAMASVIGPSVLRPNYALDVHIDCGQSNGHPGSPRSFARSLMYEASFLIQLAGESKKWVSVE